MTIKDLKSELRLKGSKSKALRSMSFFKMNAGQYSEKDIFLGLTVPEQRALAKKYKDLGYSSLKKLLSSRIHEERLTALFILDHKYVFEPKVVYEFLLKNLAGVNNWDLVDTAAPTIIGEWLKDKKTKKDRKILYRWARSEDLWQKRIAIVSTHPFILKGELDDTFAISEILLRDDHDLIHKAVGWMLREAGKKDLKRLEDFLVDNVSEMPRTMLRYAIEKFPEKKRQKYLRM